MKGARGPLHPRWKGEAVSYNGAHQRVHALRGHANHCEHCGATDPAKQYEWASISKNYTDPMDYVQLCKKCHAQFDKASFPQRTHCLQGHELTPDNLRLSNGHRRCLRCYRDGARKWKEQNAAHRASYRKDYHARTGK
jgi:hypothetical protein